MVTGIYSSVNSISLYSFPSKLKTHKFETKCVIRYIFLSLYDIYSLLKNSRFKKVHIVIVLRDTESKVIVSEGLNK